MFVIMTQILGTYFVSYSVTPPQNSDALIHRETNTYLTVKASYDYKQIFFGEYKFFI